jgi:hypothetical protein
MLLIAGICSIPVVVANLMGNKLRSTNEYDKKIAEINAKANQQKTKSYNAYPQQPYQNKYAPYTKKDFSFKPKAQALDMHYYSSVDPLERKASLLITNALVVIHGYSRDANKSFSAGLSAVKSRNAIANSLVVTPIYQVPVSEAKKCMTKGVPEAASNDLTWSCTTWIEGGLSNGLNAVSSFTAMDALLVQLKKDFPNLSTITIAGFSAGAQMVQHYVGFAADVSELGVKVRYVIADPGSWLYFDRQRAQPYLNEMKVSWAQCSGGPQGLGQCQLKMEEFSTVCLGTNDWKYGLNKLPDHLPWGGSKAREQYAQANISYMEGALDSNTAKGAYYAILDKSCAANAQGPFRLQRGIVYAFYDRTLLSPDKLRTVTIIPNCAHDVACVFSSKEGSEILTAR